MVVFTHFHIYMLFFKAGAKLVYLIQLCKLCLIKPIILHNL